MIDYRADQEGLLHSIARKTFAFGELNLVGKVGADVGFLSLLYFGLLAFAFAPALFQFAYLLFFRRPRQVSLLRVLGFILLLTSGSALFEFSEHHFWPEIQSAFPEDYLPRNAGGEYGALLYNSYLRDSIGPFGSGLSLSVFFLSGIYITFSNSILSLVKRAKKIRIPLPKLPKREPKPKKVKPPKIKEPVVEQETQLPTLMKAKRNWLKPLFGKSIVETDSDDLQNDLKFQSNNKPNEKYLEELGKPMPLPQPMTGKKKRSPLKVVVLPKEPKDQQNDVIETPPEIIKTGKITIIESEKAEKGSITTPIRRGKYKFPPISLLETSTDDETLNSSTNHELIAERLKSTLEDFKIKVELGEVHIGPVITRYDLHPAPGVRVEKISALEKNLTMALQAQSVRILAPVPGKGCVGIEIPNEYPQSVRVRDILETKVWTASKAEIPIVLGKDVSGKPLVTDLTRMPHLLIAGSTGSGKTVCINAIISSLLYHSSPEDLRFIMVDPKIVEMKVFNDLPHMLIPVVTDPKKVPNALKWLISEMENRYQIFAKVGVRNIAGFNAKILKNQESRALAKTMDEELTAEERAAVSNIEVKRDDDALEIPEKKLPYIVCIIDELADLMMVAPADIETCIARLAQLARAAGIHLIIATQRPSVNVITGVIKANLPSRISFKVASKIDSRTILDGGGADTLIGRGDMLFIPPGVHHLQRAQGAFVSDEEIVELVEFLKVNGPPEILEEVQQQIDRDPDDDGGATTSADSEDWGDVLVPDAIDVIRNSKRASTSMLQRRLRIGYNRAARIMEILEDRGIVGPDNGSQPREILGDMDNF